MAAAKTTNRVITNNTINTMSNEDKSSLSKETRKPTRTKKGDNQTGETTDKPKAIRKRKRPAPEPFAAAEATKTTKRVTKKTTSKKKRVRGNPADKMLKDEVFLGKLEHTLSVGITVKKAIASLNVPDATFYGWIKLGRKFAAEGATNIYTELLERVSNAVGNAEDLQEPETNAIGEEKKPTGRPDKRGDEEVVEKFLLSVKAGQPVYRACIRAGISQDCIYRWIREGKTAPEGTLASLFYERLKLAESDAEFRKLGMIDTAAAKSKSGWQAAAWFLERKFPEEWGRKDVVRHGNVQGEVMTSVNVNANTSTNSGGNENIEEEAKARTLTDKGIKVAMAALLKRNPSMLDVTEEDEHNASD